MSQPTLAELKAELEQLSKKIAELEKQPELTAKERWEEEMDFQLSKAVNFDKWTIPVRDTNDSNLIKEQFNLMRELQTFAKLRNGDWVADWGDKGQAKTGICVLMGKIRIIRCFIYNPLVYGISFDPDKPEIAQEALEIFGERIEQFYGK